MLNLSFPKFTKTKTQRIPEVIVGFPILNTDIKNGMFSSVEDGYFDHDVMGTIRKNAAKKDKRFGTLVCRTNVKSHDGEKEEAENLPKLTCKVSPAETEDTLSSMNDEFCDLDLNHRMYRSSLYTVRSPSDSIYSPYPLSSPISPLNSPFMKWKEFRTTLDGIGCANVNNMLDGDAISYHPTNPSYSNHRLLKKDESFHSFGNEEKGSPLLNSICLQDISTKTDVETSSTVVVLREGKLSKKFKFVDVNEAMDWRGKMANFTTSEKCKVDNLVRTNKVVKSEKVKVKTSWMDPVGKTMVQPTPPTRKSSLPLNI